MDVILYGLITVLLALAVFQAFRLHKHYTKTLYPALFANYLEYFWRYQFRQNLSVSSWLKQELGFHRLLYNSVLDQNGHVAQTYVTLLCTRGAFVIRDVRSEGQTPADGNDKKLPDSQSCRRTASTLPISASGIGRRGLRRPLCLSRRRGSDACPKRVCTAALQRRRQLDQRPAGTNE